jgi:hypothetical protein
MLTLMPPQHKVCQSHKLKRHVLDMKRITVQTILAFLSAGDSSKGILAEFPRLT